MADFQGEIVALSAACLWAVASVVYGRLGEGIPPLQLKLIKAVVAIAFLLLTIFIRGDWLFQCRPSPFPLSTVPERCCRDLNRILNVDIWLLLIRNSSLFTTAEYRFLNLGTPRSENLSPKSKWCQWVCDSVDFS